MQRGHLAESEKLHTHILERDSGDLETTLNQSVIEYRTNRRKQALARVERLHRIYPNDQRVEDMLYYLR